MNQVALSHLEPIACGKRYYCIYFIAGYNFFVNRPSCYVIHQQQFQWEAYVVPRVG